MAAVIAGNGLGLFDNRLTQWGLSQIGQGGGGQYVNIATGNLVLQGQDEQVVFRGLAIAQARTYNSRGTLQAGNDGWITGFERSVALLSGTLNQTGSVVRRQTSDGGYQDFNWSATQGRYLSTAGEGADDTLVWNATTQAWTWSEGSTGAEEDYSGADGGRLAAIRAARSDAAAPAQWNLVYDAQGRIGSIVAADGTGSGDALLFGYNAGGQLASISTREGGVVRGQVAYGYDGLGRLATVTTDLTPDNAADNAATGNLDGRLFVTTYSYVDDTLQLAGLIQSDGTTLAYTYDGQGRVLTASRGTETTTYFYGSGTTTVTDGLDRTWTYAYDGAGQLVTATAPPVDGLSDVTTYSYSAGNLVQAKTTRGAAVVSQLDYQYDANDNLAWQWDALGNAIQRAYDANNLLISETRYAGVDPDRAGATLPTGGMTTRYFYDTQERLRFVVDATGSVTEYEYAIGGNGVGQQAAVRRYAAPYSSTMSTAAVDAWSATQVAAGTLTTYAYDLWGRLSQTVAYATLDVAGEGVLDAAATLTRFAYDAQGLLRQQVVVRGAGRTLGGTAPAGSQVTDYAYDGMGRLLGVVQHASEASAANDATSVATSYIYLDSGHSIATTQDNGSTRTEVRDAAGRLVSDSTAGTVAGTGGARTIEYTYDAAGQLRAVRDPSGGLSYRFYDAKGRLAATVDSTGAVAVTTYDAADRVAQVTAYANRVDTSGWLGAEGVTVADVAGIGLVTAAANDRKTTNSYDTAGRLLEQVDGEGARTQYTYDGAGQLLQVKRTDGAGTAATARTTRFFYDASGRVVGTLDGEGYLIETTYDALGRATATTRYANVAPSAQWAAGTLAQLRPALNAASDQVARYYYDARGNQVGALDAEGYLTETVVDEAGNARAQWRYGTRVTWQAGDTLASVRSRAGSKRETRLSYDAFGRLVAETNIEGTVTRHAYDEAGRLVCTTTADGVASEVREDCRRYNVFDEVIGEISGEGAVRASTLLGGKALDDATLTQSQLDQAYSAYGTCHDYDVLGRRTETIDPEGNKTWHFYNDVLGRQYTVRGVAEDAAGATGARNSQAEITETRLDAFDGVVQTIAYTGRIAIATPGSRASVQAIIDTLSYVAGVDSMRQITYDRRGLVASVGNALTSSTIYKTIYAYNAFGQLSREVRASGTSVTETIDTSYDRRGLQALRTEAVGTSDAWTESRTYDAFGHLVSVRDGNLHATTFAYDRLGRQITRSQSVQGHAETWQTAYDAWNRVVSQTDPLQQTTTYLYDTPNRQVTVTSPEGVAVTTTHDHHGQTVSVRQTLPGGMVAETIYAYDRDGQLTGTTDALGNTQENEYDERGLLAATEGADGRRIELHYDAAGRVLSRVEDPEGLALTTTFAYDAQGRRLTTTDASGRITRQTWDVLGRLTQVALDPAGINQKISYAYDARDRQITVTQGVTIVKYVYDVLGRRTSEILDSGTGTHLNLTTQYVYDDNGNVVRKTGPDGAITRYYYDEANRLVYTVDPSGTATRNWYDGAGRLVATRTGGASLAAGSLADNNTIAEVDALVDWNGAPYQGDYRVYDTDGHVRFVLSTAGSLQENLYDNAGRLVAVKRYANAVTGVSIAALLAGTATEASVSAAIAADAARDEATYRVLDADGRVLATVDALGNVEALDYDASGRIVGRHRFADTASIATLRASLAAGTATLAGVLTTVTGQSSKDPVDYVVFDAAGRQRYAIDALGAVTETRYDGAGRVAFVRHYARTVAMGSTLRAKLQAGDPAAEADVAALVAPLADDINDTRDYYIYDAAGRQVFTIDGANFATRATYNTSGMVATYRAEGLVFTIDAALRAKLEAGTATATDIPDRANNGYDHAVYNIYDTAGRLRYAVTVLTSATSVVSERRYDAAGRLTAVVEYGKVLPSVPTSETAVVSALSSAGADAPENQRLTRYVHDVDGRVRFTIDDSGVVTEQRYDGLGRVVEQRSYGQAIAPSVLMNEAAVAAAVAGIGDVHTTKMEYDAAGRVIKATDALNHFESFTYDALGNKLTNTDKLGKTWTYGYDAAGRLTSETSPQVQVSASAIDGTVTTATRAIVTRTAYDALGNVITRTEDADGSAPRSIEYRYDNRGHQVATIFPPAGRIDPATGQLVASAAVQINVTYDALGRAVVEQDALGNYSYKVYDTRGNLAYEVDQEGYVTSYGYDGFGQQTTLKRYSTKIVTSAIPGWVPGTAINLAQMQVAGVVPTNSADRTLTTTWDLLGRKKTVAQGSVSYVNSSGTTATGYPTSRLEYDAYGKIVRESVLLEGTVAAGTWADTWHYYDAMGRQVRTVDAEGYVTAWQYDARGQAIVQVEFARAIDTAALAVGTLPALPVAGNAQTGYDRSVVYAYDALGRKTSETAKHLVQSTSGSSALTDSLTEYDYDAESHLLETSVDGTRTSSVAYDALGRAISVTEASRQALVSDWQARLVAGTGVDLSSSSLYATVAPTTTMQYDAFGNAVRVTRAGTGVTSQVTTTVYDAQGRALVTRDAEGTVWYSAYDATDHLIDSWYALSINGSSMTVHTTATYDLIGRQITTTTTRGAVTDAASAVRYDAFGGITSKAATLATLGSSTAAANYTYDRAGNLLTSNAETGKTRTYRYDLAGHQVREERPWTDGTTSATAIYASTVDKLGRAILQQAPSWSADATAVAQTSFVRDRWGNVLRQVDARGFVTEYFYNDRNQLIRQVAPSVKVVDEAGNESWQKPETRWMYDALGRLIASQDANGRTRRFEYDAAGQLVRSIDATGAASRQGYDVLGRSLATQDALGHIAFVDFDRLDRAVAQGDFLANAAGTARTKSTLQAYLLNQNGDRLQVTDATGRWTKYDYDSRDLLVRSQTQAGVVHTYTYDTQGRKTLDLDGLGKSNTWTYDYYGRLTDHDDLGGADYNYTYDARSGLLTATTSSRTSTAPAPGGRDPWDFEDPEVTDPIVLTEQLLDRKIEYYANGQVKRISDGNIFYAYAYDAAGNRTREETKTVDGRGMTVHTTTRIAYDSNNRMSRITTQDMATGAYTLDLSYDYDAVGNRRRVIANSAYQGTALDVGNQSPVATGSLQAVTIKAGTAVEWTLRASDYVQDPDGTALLYSLTLANGSPVPSWLHMTYDDGTGLIRLSADAGSSAALGQTFSLRLVATDTPIDPADALSVGMPFSLQVVANTAPVATHSGTISVFAPPGVPFEQEFQVSDYFADTDVGDTLTLSLDPLPAALDAWLDVDTSIPGLIRIYGTPTALATYSLVLRARDGSNATATQAVSLQVVANRAPIILSSIPAQTGKVGIAYSAAFDASQLFQDPDGDVIDYTLVLTDPKSGWLTLQYDAQQGQILLSGLPENEAQSGSYTVILRATDSTDPGLHTDLAITFTIASANIAPQVDNPIPDQVANATGGAWSYSFPAGTFSDPNGTALSYTQSGMPSWMSFNATTRTFSGTPSSIGSWAITVTASDGSLSARDTFTVSVANVAPTVQNPIAGQSAAATTPWTFTFAANTFYDANGDTLTYGVVQETRVRVYDEISGTYYWDVVESEIPSWMTFNSNTRTFAGTPPSTAVGQTYDLYISAYDGHGYSAVDSFVLTIGPAPNQAPTLVTPIPNQTATATGGSWSYTVPAGTFNDPEGGALTYTQSGMPSWMSFNATTRAFSGVPSTVGSWNITVTAQDPSGATVSDTFTVTTPNAAPIVASAIPDQSVGAGQVWSYTIPAGAFVDRNGQSLTFSQPTGMPAWMSFNATTRTFSGTASAASGSWNITVTASDGSLSVSDTFTVSAANVAPTVQNPIADQSAAAGVAWSYTVPSGTFSDGNGDALSYEAYEWVRTSEWDPDLQKPIFYWEAQSLPSWLTFTASTRTFTGTPPAQDSIQLQIWANDGHGGNSTDTFTLTIGPAPNQAPTVPSPIPDQTATATGGSWSYTVPAGTFNDPEGGALTYTQSGMPSWMSFNATTRAFSGVPSTIGSWNITVTAHDPAGAAVSDTFTVTTPNAAPVVASAIPNQTATAGVAWSYSFPASTFVDRNGQALTYTASGMPAWMAFDAGTRTFSGASSTAGSWNITVTASDGSLTTTDTFTVTIGNLAPTVANPIPDQSAVVTQAWSYTVPSGTFSDGNGDALSYEAYEWVRTSEWDPELQKPIFYWEAQPLPSWLTFTASTRNFTGTPPAQGSIQLKVSVNDGHGGYSTNTFILTIGPAPNQAPTVPSPIPNQTANATGGNWSYTFPTSTFSDPEGGALTYTVSGMPTWMIFNASTRAFSGIPAAVGSWNITVTAHDPSGATVSDTFTVTTPNVAPRIVTAIPDKTATVGQAFSYTFPEFADYNGQALTYALAGMPAWMAFNASTRTLSGTPTAAATYTLTATASDGSLTASDSFVLTVSTAPPVENRAPVVNRPLVDQEEYLSYTFAADTFVDPDGDTLTYTYTVSPLNAGITFDPATRHFDGTGPGGKYGKNYIITVTAADGHGHAVSDSFSLYVSGYMDPLSMESGGDDLFAAMQASSLQAETDAEQQMLPPPDDGGDPPDGGGTGGTGGTTVPNVQELWFTYDAENRVQVVNGELVNGQIVVATDDGSDDIASYALQYDAAGNAVSRTTVALNGGGTPTTRIAQSTYTARGQLQTEYAEVTVGGMTGVVARHTYDAAGREIDQTQYFAPDTWRTYRTGNPNYPDTEYIDVDISGWRSHQTVTTYDADGRVSGVDEFGRQGQTGWLAGSPDPALTALSKVLYSNASNVSGYDAAGRLTTYRYQRLASAYTPDALAYTHTYTTTYEARDTYLEKSVAGSSDNTSYKPTTTTSTYDPTGRRVALTQNTPISGQDPITRLRYFSYDGDGGILTRRDGTLSGSTFTETANSRQHYAYANGQQVATLGEDGTIDAASQLTAFDSSDLGTEPALVLEGDTLQSIAQRVYGNSSLWYVLAAANAVTDADLVAGTALKAPSVKTTANDASTFKPYDPSKIEGPTTPSLPYISPPPQPQCDGLMMVLMVAIAVIVTVYTAGAASAAFGAAATGTGATAGLAAGTAAGTAAAGGIGATGAAALAGGYGAAGIAGAAVGGFVGSAVSQEFGKAIGAVDHFSLRGAVASGLTAGITAGVGSQLGSMKELIEAGKWGKVAASGALVSAGGFTANRIAGIDASFSWRSVAADALSAVVAGKINKKLGTVFEPGVSNGIARDTMSGLVGGVVSVHAHRALGDDRAIDYGQIAADAFGNALGNAFISSRNLQQVMPQSANRDEDSFGMAQAMDAWNRQASLGPLGDGTSFLDRNPYATASLASGGWPMGSMDNGDRPRGNAIAVSPVASSTDDPSIPTLGTVVVTGDRSQDTWFMAMWDWSNQYHMAPPPATGNRAELVQYWSDATRQLAPAYNQWVAQSAGSVINRTSTQSMPSLPSSPVDHGASMIYEAVASFTQSEPYQNGSSITNAAGAVADVSAYGMFVSAAAGRAGLAVNFAADGSMYIPMLLQSGGKSVGYLSAPSTSFSLVRNAQTSNVLLDLAKAAPALEKWAFRFGFAGLGLEAVQTYTNPAADGGDWGHLGASGGAFALGAWGGPWGLAAATAFTITDIPLQYYHYTPTYGPQAGKDTAGWRALMHTQLDASQQEYLERSNASGKSVEEIWYEDKILGY
jgi:YD repeat-containing protein